MQLTVTGNGKTKIQRWGLNYTDLPPTDQHGIVAWGKDNPEQNLP